MPARVSLPPSGAIVYFGGSRSLPSAATPPLVAPVVSGVLAAGLSIAVGDAIGADAAVILHTLAQGAASSLFVASVALPSGGGAWPGTAIEPVVKAHRAGAVVTWAAGGHPQRVPIRARLIRRSLAALAPASLAVFFLSSPSSRGSLAVARHAAARGVPVVAIPCCFQGAPASLGAGLWLPAEIFGVSAWLWQPPKQLPLF